MKTPKGNLLIDGWYGYSWFVELVKFLEKIKTDFMLYPKIRHIRSCQKNAIREQVLHFYIELIIEN